MIRKHQIFPDEKLFFGMEELDFDLKIKKIGYSLLVDRPFYHQHRLRGNRVAVPIRILRVKPDNLRVRQ